MNNTKALEKKIRYHLSCNMQLHFLCVNWFNKDGSMTKPKKVLYSFTDGPDDTFSLVLEDGTEIAAGDSIDEYDFTQYEETNAF